MIQPICYVNFEFFMCLIFLWSNSWELNVYILKKDLEQIDWNINTSVSFISKIVDVEKTLKLETYMNQNMLSRFLFYQNSVRYTNIVLNSTILKQKSEKQGEKLSVYIRPVYGWDQPCICGPHHTIPPSPSCRENVLVIPGGNGISQQHRQSVKHITLCIAKSVCHMGCCPP